MGPVPAAINLNVPEAEIGTQIDDPFAMFEQGRDDIHGGLMGQGCKCQIEAGDHPRQVHFFQNLLASSCEGRVDFAYPLSRILLRTEHRQAHPGMTHQDTQQLQPRVPCGTKNSHTELSLSLDGIAPSRCQGSQRLEYCGRLRALWRPYFFRSTARGSRVTKPAFFNGERNSGFTFNRARVIP